MLIPFQLDGGIRQALHQLKYRNLRALAAPLAEPLGDYFPVNPVPGEVLVPVPLHKNKLRKRGYNQFHLPARYLGKHINLPVTDDCLIRQHHSPPQTRTPGLEERRCNVVSAFACRNRSLEAKQVMLIDDVTTSGVTIDACTSV